MKLVGSVTGASKSLLTGKVALTLEVDWRGAGSPDFGEILNQGEMDVEIKKHSVRRSLDANAYFHVLVGKLADEMRISKPYCKNLMLGRYGQPFLTGAGADAIIKTNIPANQMMEGDAFHCMPCARREEAGGDVTFYRVMRGSSTYNAKEMSILIDGTVQECKQLGIETMTPDEMKRMLAAWKAKKGD